VALVDGRPGLSSGSLRCSLGAQTSHTTAFRIHLPKYATSTSVVPAIVPPAAVPRLCKNMLMLLDIISSTVSRNFASSSLSRTAGATLAGFSALHRRSGRHPLPELLPHLFSDSFLTRRAVIGTIAAFVRGPSLSPELPPSNQRSPARSSRPASCCPPWCARGVLPSFSSARQRTTYAT
jgi:hypothetical protein